MIRITNVYIENYRSCINTKFRLRNNLTAIIGANGAGKSNILNSFLLLGGRIRGPRMYRNREQELNESTSKSTIIYDIDIDSSKYKLKADIFLETDERNSDAVFFQYSI